MFHSHFKKIGFLFIFLVCNFKLVFCQQVATEAPISDKSKVAIKLFTAYLIPTGSFKELSDNDYETYNITAAYTDFNLAGKATGGIYGGTEIIYKFHRCFEMGLHVGYATINTDPSNFRDLFDLDSLTEISYSSTSTNWETISTLLSASGNVLFKKWKGTVSVMAGIQYAWSPAVTLNRNIPETGTFNGVDAFHITYTQPSRKHAAPCYGASANLSYMLNKKISININGLYQTSAHDFDEGGTADYKASIMTPQGIDTTVITKREFNFSKTIRFFAAGLGITYSL
jgi:hypothetical protein